MKSYFRIFGAYFSEPLPFATTSFLSLICYLVYTLTKEIKDMQPQARLKDLEWTSTANQTISDHCSNDE